ncbi:MAG TPA: hypothetical protein VF089_20240 [Candidatus Binatia bacterium]
MMETNSVPQTAELFVIDQFFERAVIPHIGHLGSRRYFKVLISIAGQRQFCRD